jgi:hypothetical protein
MKRRFFYIVLFCFVSSLSAQNIPVVTGPKIITPNNIVNAYPGNQQVSPYNPNEIQQRIRTNQDLINESRIHLQQESQRQSAIKTLLSSGFSSLSQMEGTSHFYEAFDEILQMLKGEIPLNLGRTVFLVENAYYGDSIDYAEFREAIKNKVALCNTKIKEENLDGSDNMVKNSMLYRFLTDTVKVENAGKTIMSLPLKYNLEDYISEQNYDSHFVMKLMQTGIGQCHSMPLYYLVLAEEIGSEAYWSFSPKHSFVKIKDDNEDWYNLELTCSAILSDAHYMNNSYIKAEALRNRIYLEPMDKENTIAEMLIDLARGYYRKYGLDDFTLKCLDTAMEYLDNDLNALMFKSFYETELTLALARLLQAPNPETLKEKSPEAYEHFEMMQNLYKQIDDLGYEELPASLYVRWLEHIEREKSKSEKEKSIFLKPTDNR